MAGCLLVSFAGTLDEAREFASQHEGITAPNKKARSGDDGLPMLAAKFKNNAEREQKSKLLSSLGWDHEFQQQTRY